MDQAISNTGGTGKLNVVLDADNNNGVRDGAGIVMLNNDVTTNGGNLTFGTGATLSINGGAVNVQGEMIIANTNGLTINSNGGNVRFYGLLNSGNQYTFVDKTGSVGIGSWSEARAEAIGITGGGSAVNDSYLATITSRLENSVAVRAAGYKGAWIGAYRPNESTGAWVWSNGPEANQQFFTQTTNSSGGVTTSGYYSNFGTGEPNGSMTVTPAESVGQFFGTTGQWNDLSNATTYSATQVTQYSVLGFVKETNLAASPLTVNAGSGTATFSGAVGASKSLSSPNVTSSGGIAINGGTVTTQGVQTYNGNVTLGSAATTLTQTNANTDFTVQSGKTITNATGADASLTIKTTGSILMNNLSSISSSSGKLNTVFWADSDANSSGMIYLNTATVNTNGGHLWMGGGTASGTLWNGLTVGNGYAVGDATMSSGIGIRASTINTAGGNIAMYGKGRNGAVANPNNFGDNTNGIRLNYSNTIDSGTGTIYLKGIAQDSGGSANGIELSSNGGADLIKSANTTADAIYMYGESANPGSAINAWGVYTWTTTIEATGAGGGITLEGKGYKNNGVTIPVNSSVLATSGQITLTGLGYGSGAVAVAVDGNVGLKAGTDVTSSSSNIVINGDTFSSSGNIASTGTLTIAPYTAGRAINIGTTGASTLNIASSYFSTNFTNGFSGITIGNASAGAITVGGATTFNDSTTLRSNATIAINGAVTANENLTLTGNGAITQSAALAVTGTTAITAGSANDITLTNTSSNFTGAVSVVTGNNVSLIDSNAMTLGAVTASGTVDVATLTNDLTLTGAVSTSNSGASAVKLNAGKNTSAGTSTGGNIVVSGGSVSEGAGGTAQLYSGSLSGSTGLAALAVSGSGRFRYDADETTDFSADSWTALSSGLHAIYREQPTLTVTASDASKTYDGNAYNGGNGVTNSGLINGDTAVSALGGTLTYGGTSQGATAVGTYNITPGGYSSKRGYALAYVNGSLAISAVPSSSGTESRQAAVHSAQLLPPTSVPSPAVSGGLEFVNVLSDANGGPTPPRPPLTEGGRHSDGGIHFPAHATPPVTD